MSESEKRSLLLLKISDNVEAYRSFILDLVKDPDVDRALYLVDELGRMMVQLITTVVGDV